MGDIHLVYNAPKPPSLGEGSFEWLVRLAARFARQIMREWRQTMVLKRYPELQLTNW